MYDGRTLLGCVKAGPCVGREVYYVLLLLLLLLQMTVELRLQYTLSTEEAGSGGYTVTSHSS